MPTRIDRTDLRTATRYDGNGTTERIELRGSDGDRIFTCLYLPEQAPRGAVLICPPLHAEFTKNYRREVVLARRLAAEGFAVERFHYRGMGNSDREGRDLTFETMREDAVSCLAHVLAESGASDRFVLGTRWAALLAAAAAATDPVASLVLWEPVLDAARFFKDAFRSRVVADRAVGTERLATGEELIGRLRVGQSVDVVGHTIEPGLYESSIRRTLAGELGSTPRAVLVLQIGRSSTLRPGLFAQVERWRGEGFPVDARTIEGDETWWLIDERRQNGGDRPMARELIASTVAWIGARSAERRSR